MLLTVRNRQRSLRIDADALRRLVAALGALSAAGRRRAPDYESVTLVICGDAEISRVHATVFGDPGTTDVITLPYAATPASGAAAEIFVNARLARDFHGASGAERELALYIAHGFDHLAGHDDRAARPRAAMRRRELAWLDACGGQGLIDGVLCV